MMMCRALDGEQIQEIQIMDPDSFAGVSCAVPAVGLLGWILDIMQETEEVNTYFLPRSAVKIELPFEAAACDAHPYRACFVA